MFEIYGFILSALLYFPMPQAITRKDYSFTFEDKIQIDLTFKDVDISAQTVDFYIKEDKDDDDPLLKHENIALTYGGTNTTGQILIPTSAFSSLTRDTFKGFHEAKLKDGTNDPSTFLVGDSFFVFESIHNFDFYKEVSQNDKVVFPVTVPEDLTGGTATLYIKKNIKDIDGDAVITKALTDADFTINAGTTTYTFTIDVADWKEGLSDEVTPGRYAIVMEYTDSSGNQTTNVTGTLKLFQDAA